MKVFLKSYQKFKLIKSLFACLQCLTHLYPCKPGEEEESLLVVKGDSWHPLSLLGEQAILF